MTDTRTPRFTPPIGEERGYWLRVAELTVLDVTTPNFALTVFPLAHKGIDGLVSMNFLRHFNFEVRPADRQIVLELLEGGAAAL